MPTITAADLTAVTENIAKAAAEIARAAASMGTHIATEAKKIGDARGVQYARTAEEQIADVRKKAAIEVQRRDDVIAELRKQIEIQVRRAESVEGNYRRLMAERDDLSRRLDNVRQCRSWTDTLGRKYVFADELWHATDPEHNPPPAPVRLDKEN